MLILLKFGAKIGHKNGIIWGFVNVLVENVGFLAKSSNFDRMRV